MKASSSVSKKKNGMVGRKDILGNGLGFEARFVENRKELLNLLKSLRLLGYKIVYTAGVWDLLHLGHCTYLQAAKKQGDILIVGVDSDKLTRQRKGPNRPTVPQDERLQILAHTRWVDIIVLRDVNEGLEVLVKQIRPDVWVTSYTTADVGRQVKRRLGKYCGKIVTLDTQSPNVSTTKRISELERSGLGQLGRDLIELIQKHNIDLPAIDGPAKVKRKKR